MIPIPTHLHFKLDYHASFMYFAILSDFYYLKNCFFLQNETVTRISDFSFIPNYKRILIKLHVLEITFDLKSIMKPSNVYFFTKCMLLSGTNHGTAFQISRII